MRDAKRQNRRRKPATDAPEIRVVGIDVKPAPDAQARLHRLITILLKLAEDDLPPTATDPPPDDGIAEGG